MKLKFINIERIKADYKRIKFKRTDKYFDSYFEFVEFFKSKKVINTNDLIISSHFVYGWMPTILQMEMELLDDAVSILNKVKCGERLVYHEIDKVKKFINNSLVGSSKLLHFVNPYSYAIWDSRVYRYYTAYKSQHRIGDIHLYFHYLEKINELIENNEYDNIHQEITMTLNREMSKLRTIELIMFKVDELHNKK